jgi:hypothetical protein
MRCGSKPQGNAVADVDLNKINEFRETQPAKVDSMAVACRAFAADAIFQEYSNLIAHCMAFGQAAGTAAALSVKNGVDLRKVNIGALQVSLGKQGVPLPNGA